MGFCQIVQLLTFESKGYWGWHDVFGPKRQLGSPVSYMQKQEMTGKTICKKKVIHDNDLQKSDIVQHILKKVFCYNIFFLIKSDSILQSHRQKAQEQSLPWSITVISFAWPSTWLARAKVWIFQFSNIWIFFSRWVKAEKRGFWLTKARSIKTFPASRYALSRESGSLQIFFSTACPLVVVTV